MDYFVGTNGQRFLVESATLSRCLSDTRNAGCDGSIFRVSSFLDIDLSEALSVDGGVFDRADGRSAFGDIAIVLAQGDTEIVFFLDEDTIELEKNTIP